jgi:hypothetical protein
VYKYWEFQIPAVLDNGILSGPSEVIQKKPRKLVDKRWSAQYGYYLENCWSWWYPDSKAGCWKCWWLVGNVDVLLLLVLGGNTIVGCVLVLIYLAHYYLESVRLLYRSNGMCEVKLGAVV